jgi:hypothetical protein
MRIYKLIVVRRGQIVFVCALLDRGYYNRGPMRVYSRADAPGVLDFMHRHRALIPAGVSATTARRRRGRRSQGHRIFMEAEQLREPADEENLFGEGAFHHQRHDVPQFARGIGLWIK